MCLRRRANLVSMLLYKLRRLSLAQKLLGIPANTHIMDFVRLNSSLGIENKRPSERLSLFFHEWEI